MSEEKRIDVKNKSIRIAITGITAALYIALGYIFAPISFLGIQFRVAELIVGMCIIFPVAGLIGNVIGVFVVNMVSPLGILDVIIAPLVNIPALALIGLLRNEKYLNYVGGILYAMIISLYVAWLLWFMIGLPFWIMFIQVFIAEMILATLGISLFEIVKKQLNLGG